MGPVPNPGPFGGDAVLGTGVVLLATFLALLPALPQLLAWPKDAALLGVLLAVAAGQLLLLWRVNARLVAEKAHTVRLLAHHRDLYHELQHRVSNGIQSVASSLSLQAAMIGNADTEDALREAAERLLGVAEVHRRLHDPALDGPGLGEALRGLVQRLLASAGLGHVEVAIDAESPPLGHERASILAMIVAEAVANSIKHAYRGRDAGRLEVSLRPVPGQRLLLRVSDDGPGAVREPEADEVSLGMLIMRGLADRLHGTLGFGPGAQAGASLNVEFPAMPPARG